MCAVKLLNAQH